MKYLKLICLLPFMLIASCETLLPEGSTVSVGFTVPHKPSK